MVTTDPLVPAEARDSRKCTARSKRSGKPCERWSMVGQTTCAMHGGKAPQALRKAQAAVELADPDRHRDDAHRRPYMSRQAFRLPA